jgi:peptide/nickel transport system substrate-binding protein
MLLLVAGLTIAWAQSDQMLRVLLSSTLTTLEPQETTDTDSAAVRYQIYNGLVRMNEAGQPTPDLAESWQISEDGTVYTFQLRAGVTFHDGTPLNAEAVKASFERLTAEDRDTSASNFFKPVIDSIAAVDDLTVQFTLKEPFAPFVNHLGHPAGHVISPAAAESFGAALGENPVGTGPYKFVEWVRGERVELERFDDYFEGTPALGGIEYRVVPEAATRVALLETGEADVILRISPDEAERLEGTAGIGLIKTPTARTIFMAINTTRPPFDDVRVRQALNYAVDVQAIVGAIFGEGVPLSDSPLAPQVFGHVPTFGYGHDPERALALLAAAGLEPGDVTINLWSPNGRYVQDALVAQAVGQQLDEFGFDVDVRLFGDFREYIDVAFVEDRGDLLLLGWAPSTLDAEGGLFQILHGERANAFANNSGFANPVFDALVNQARSVSDPEARVNLYGQAQAVVMAEAPWLFLYVQPVITGVAEGVSDIVILPSEQLYLRNAKKQ